MKKVFALVDCNNFFVSCERLFDPSSKNTPAVVFSNNDGCIIARSNEAKRIGIKMGEPVFQCKEIMDFFKVRGYSTNFSLYKDLSNRVMTILSYYASDMQVYSVDEAFLDLSQTIISNWWKLGREIKDSVYKYVGIPISIGISTSKTLAKVASKLAKKSDGVFVLIDNKEEYLQTFDVSDVWGIGRATTKKLLKINVRNALDYINLDDRYILNHFGVNGLRTWWELKGESVISLHDSSALPKMVSHTRTFKDAISDYEKLRIKISHFASSISFQMRQQKLLCSHLIVFVRENRFTGGYYGNMSLVKMEKASNLSVDISKYAIKGLDRVFKNGKKYKKAGVIALKIESEIGYNNLFEKKDENRIKAQTGVDILNGHWERAVLLGSEFEKKSIIKRMTKTLGYTTNYNEIRVVF